MTARLKEQIEFSIIGAGRFGSFWGRHLSKFYPTCFYDTDPEKESQVKRFAEWQPLETCLQKKYIFLTIPIGKIEKFLSQHAGSIRPSSVIVDCASVKGPVINWFERYLPGDVYYVASHPLFGPDSARSHLDDHIMVLLPGHIPFNDYRFLVKLLIDKLKLQVYNMTAEEHDEMMAYNLNLVHHLGRALHELGIGRLPLMMSGLKKLNEIVSVVMNDTQELFTDFYKYNHHAGHILGEWEKSYHKISRAVQIQKQDQKK
jgi:prephenate dehydrogenase